jgi:tRNA/tmRNA/rRNA uracil-C5-methylase (TrmA/RlmC/RlmD family)
LHCLAWNSETNSFPFDCDFVISGIENAVYIAGKAEDTIWGAIKIFDKHKVDAVVAAAKASIASGATFVAPASDPDVNLVGIVDPPRSGLHPTVVKALRSCNKLNRLVYVSCNPSSLAANLHFFLQPPSKRYRGRPFVATRAAAFDLFPHTKHCEMIVLLEREELKPQNTNAAAAAAPAEASTASEAPQPQ